MLTIIKQCCCWLKDMEASLGDERCAGSDESLQQSPCHWSVIECICTINPRLSVEGLCNLNKIPINEIPMEVGGGDGSSSQSEFLGGNRPKTVLSVLIFGVLYHNKFFFVCLITLLKVVSRYDLSVLSMSVMASYKSLDDFYDPLSSFFGKLFNFAKHLKEYDMPML